MHTCSLSHEYNLSTQWLALSDNKVFYSEQELLALSLSRSWMKIKICMKYKIQMNIKKTHLNMNIQLMLRESKELYIFTAATLLKYCFIAYFERSLVWMFPEPLDLRLCDISWSASLKMDHLKWYQQWIWFIAKTDFDIWSTTGVTFMSKERCISYLKG